MVSSLLRHGLALCCVAASLMSTPAAAQSWELERRLATAMNSQNAERAQSTVVALLGYEEQLETRNTLECLNAYLLELVLSRSLEERSQPAQALRDVAVHARELHEAYARCSRARVDIPLDVARVERLGSQLPDLAHAEEQALRSAGSPNDLRPAFTVELARIANALEPGIPDAWERALGLYNTLPSPRPRPPDPPPRRIHSPVPFVATGVATLGFGFLSFMTSLAGAASGDGMHRRSAGGWGLTLGLIGALPGAYAWVEPSRPLYITAASLLTLTTGIGAALQISDRRNRRFFGRGLLIGSAANLLWTLGAVLLHGPQRPSPQVTVGMWMPEDGGGLAVSGRF